MRNNENGNNSNILLSQFIQQLPFWNRIVYAGMIICWVNSLFNIIPVEYVACHVPQESYSIIWTVFTSAFYVSNLLKLVIIITNLSSFFDRLQRRTSTQLIILKYLGIHIIITLITLIIDYLIYPTETGNNKQIHLYGIEGIWFNMIYKFCHLNNNQDIKLLFFQFKFKRIYYPFILMTIYCCFSFTINIFVGIIIAVLQIKYEGYYLTYLSKIIQFISSKIKLNKEYGWINYNSNYNKFISQKSAFQNLQNNTNQFQPLTTNDKKGDSDYFANKNGVRIG